MGVFFGCIRGAQKKYINYCCRLFCAAVVQWVCCHGHLVFSLRPPVPRPTQESDSVKLPDEPTRTRGPVRAVARTGGAGLKLRRRHRGRLQKCKTLGRISVFRMKAIFFPFTLSFVLFQMTQNDKKKTSNLFKSGICCRTLEYTVNKVKFLP